MNLQGRNLAIDTQGEDVWLLKSELRQLSFDIPDDEIQVAFFGPDTREVVLRFQQANRLEPTGVVDVGTAALINARVEARRPMVVRGQVLQPDGSPFSSALVRAFDKDLRSEELLGEVTTDEAGRYEITYSAEQFRRPEKDSAALHLRVYNPPTKECSGSVWQTREAAVQAERPRSGRTETRARIDAETRDESQREGGEEYVYQVVASDVAKRLAAMDL
jgi:peptidoglycan hydrolase-like protein with peptidoglycan-binding domain